VERCKRVLGEGRVISSPAVLIARVGTPSPQKVTVYTGGDEVVLSDCVIALRCKSVRHADDTRALILRNWPRFARRYQGTCARFITMTRLQSFLLSLQVSTKTTASHRATSSVGRTLYASSGASVVPKKCAG
jgi:hypothetical protein